MIKDIGPEMEGNANAISALQTVRWYIEEAYPGIFDPEQMDDLDEDEIELLDAIHRLDAIIKWIPMVTEYNIKLIMFGRELTIKEFMNGE